MTRRLHSTSSLSGIAVFVACILAQIGRCEGFCPGRTPHVPGHLTTQPVTHRRGERRILHSLALTDDSNHNNNDKTNEQEQPPSIVMTSSSLSKLTVPQLKDHLRQFGLPVSGKKQQLVDRLLSIEQPQEHEQMEDEEEEEEAHQQIEDDDGPALVLDDSDDTTTHNHLYDESSVREETWQETMSSFDDLGIHPSVLSAIRAQPGWDRPTPVQELAIPRLLEHVSTTTATTNPRHNDDTAVSPDAFWCEAPTGSGKTAAYAIPLLQNLLSRRQERYRQTVSRRSGVSDGNNMGESPTERISALVLCPTRELAVQISGVFEQLTNNLKKRHNVHQDLNTMILHGGVPIEPQIAQLADYSRFGQTLDVCIATPGRLVDILTYYDDGENTSTRDAAMERRLLQAFEKYGDDVSLETLQKLGLDEISSQVDSSDDGRAILNTMLDGLQYLVLDEADRLLGNGFQTELDAVMDLMPTAGDWTSEHDDDDDSNSKSEIPAIWLFSATFPKAIEPRLDHVLKRLGATKSPVRVKCSNSDRLLSEDIPVSSSLQKRLERSTTVTSASNFQQIGPASTIQLRTIRLEKPARTQALRKLLEEDYRYEWDRVLVFVATRYASEHVSRKLRRAGIRCSELHGKLDQDARMRRLRDLKSGKIRVLLSTDVASRGIDISGLSAVVNYDLPRSTSDFVHRIGRTGRAGKEGIAVTFVTPADEAHMDLIEQRHLTTPTEREVLKGFEPNEERWKIQAEGARISAPGALHSPRGLVHDRMFGGVKGRRKSKKDRLREQAAAKAAAQRRT